MVHAAGKDADAPLELRIHGIGEHSTGDMFGRQDEVPVFSDGYRSDVRLFVNGVLKWRIGFLNWKVRRNVRSRLYWVITAPFTAINSAAFMQPDDKGPARLSRAIAVLSGLIATILVVLWLTVIAETVLREVDDVVPLLGNALSYDIAASIILLGLLVFIWRPPSGTHGYRRWFRPIEKEGFRGRLLHTVIVLGLGGIFVLGPGLSWFTLSEYLPSKGVSSSWVQLGVLLQPYGHAGFIDAASLLAMAISATLVILSIVVASILRNGAARVPLVGSAMSSMLGLNLLLFFMAALRNAFHHLAVWCCKVENTYDDYHVRNVLPYQPKDTYYIMDVIVIASFSALVSLVLPALFIRLAGANARNRIHVWCKFTRNLKNWFTPFALTAVALHLFILSWILLKSQDGKFIGLNVFTYIIWVLSAVVILFVIFQPSFWRRTIGMGGDIMAFWPNRFHPLAAASYRPKILKEIIACVEKAPSQKSIALVGHSQGSVLAACVVGGKFIKPLNRRVHLVTCGSPLATLYATFFPKHFNNDFFGRVALSSGEDWTNVWRDSDPIASENPWCTQRTDFRTVDHGRGLLRAR